MIIATETTATKQTKFLIRINDEHDDDRSTIVPCGRMICITDDTGTSVYVNPSLLLAALFSAIQDNWFELSAVSYCLMKQIINGITKRSK